jgi:hypothetical protein
VSTELDIIGPWSEVKLDILRRRPITTPLTEILPTTGPS